MSAPANDHLRDLRAALAKAMIEVSRLHNTLRIYGRGLQATPALDAIEAALLHCALLERASAHTCPPSAHTHPPK